MNAGLEGRVALVTGGAGGIGSAVCRALAAEGARVVVHHHTKAREAAELAAELRAKSGGDHIALGANLTREPDVVALFSDIDTRMGRCDVLVANAARRFAEPVPVADMSLEQWQASTAVNLAGVFLCCREFLRLVRRRGPADASVVLIGSTAGTFGEAGYADYAAAKGALQTGLTKTLKNEIVRIAPHGRVNAVCPGWTITPANRARLADAAVVRRVLATRPLPRMGRPEDVAAAVVFYASPSLSGHISGECVTVAGGMEGRMLHALDDIDTAQA